ncbi:hypothetical protein D7Y09_17800, partial [bacterium 1XD42-1]
EKKMNEFMKILLSLSVSGALLLLLILGLKPLYKNRFSKRWQYYIWIVVALRFLLPFTPDTTIVGSLFEKFDTAAITDVSWPPASFCRQKPFRWGAGFPVVNCCQP